MSKLFLALALGLFAPNTLWSDDIPPERFQGSGATMTFYLPVADVRRLCGGVETVATVFACSYHNTNGTWITILPNPCLVARSEDYARLACHEKGHTLGWSLMHER